MLAMDAATKSEESRVKAARRNGKHTKAPYIDSVGKVNADPIFVVNII